MSHYYTPVYYIPVTGHVSPYLAFEHWASHESRTVPYILEVTVEELANGIVDMWKGMEVRVIGLYISVPKRAIYDTVTEAKRAITDHAPIYTLKAINTASS